MGNILYFLKVFTAGFSFDYFAWFFYYLLTILIFAALFFKIKKNSILSKKLFGIIFIIGVLGTLYELTYVFFGYGHPGFNIGDKSVHFVYNGIAHAIQPLILVIFCWLIFSALDVFIKQRNER